MADRQHSMIELIERKRDGHVLSPDQLTWIIEQYTADAIPDYQMSSLLMAIFLNGFTADELAPWTEAMLHSGDVLDFSHVAAPKVDKHSTGGVGDKMSIPLAPGRCWTDPAGPSDWTTFAIFQARFLFTPSRRARARGLVGSALIEASASVRAPRRLQKVWFSSVSSVWVSIVLVF